jgi:hypothetical protein
VIVPRQRELAGYLPAARLADDQNG